MKKILAVVLIFGSLCSYAFADNGGYHTVCDASLLGGAYASDASRIIQNLIQKNNDSGFAKVVSTTSFMDAERNAVFCVTSGK